MVILVYQADASLLDVRKDIIGDSTGRKQVLKPRRSSCFYLLVVSDEHGAGTFL